MSKLEKHELSKNDLERRDFILNHNMWKVVLRICIPLALYQLANQIFKVVDSRMAAHISSIAVSSVAYLSQINTMISAIGGGLAVGASLKISQSYGEGNFSMVKKRVSSLYAISLLLGIGVLIVFVPFSETFLRIMKTPKDIIMIGKNYFIIEICSISIRFFNNVYIAVERAKGNTKRILLLNLGLIIFKLGLTGYFVYGLGGNVTLIALATLMAEVGLFMFAIKCAFFEKSIFRFSLKSIAFNRKVTLPMLSLAYPVVGEKLAFSFGKVLVNSMSTIYGTFVVGALGISNNIAGLATSVFIGFQEGGAAIISQNRGAGKGSRALEVFKILLIVNLCMGFIGLIVTWSFIDAICALFTDGDIQFQQLIKHTYSYDMVSHIMLAINTSVMALLYGFGMTKIAMLINFARLFVFRVPVLLFLQTFTNLGSESVGIVMMVSHVGVGILSAIVGLLYVTKIKNNNTEVVS